MHQLPLLSPDEQLEPVDIATGITAPLLWAERIVLLSHPNPSKEIRSIPFKPGLNVVRTERRKPNERKCVAHDVGKTLLVRLLRYTLGDPWFGDRTTMERVKATYPFGLAIAQWHLADDHWTVVRALDETWQLGYAIHGFDWAASLDDEADRLPLESFLGEINAQLKSDLSKMLLPNGTEAGFADILPWLTRDTQFGFHKADCWRDKDVTAGQPTSPSTNRLLMKWLIGLMSPAEVNSRNLKHAARSESKEKATELEKNATRLAALYESLQAAAAFRPPERADSDEAIAIEELADELIAFINERFRAVQARNTEAERGDARSLHEAEQEIKGLRNKRSATMRQDEHAKAKLQQLTNNLDSEAKDAEPPDRCPAGAKCAWRIEIERNSMAGGPIKHESHMERLRSELSNAKIERDQCAAEFASADGKVELAERELADLRSRVNSDGLQRQRECSQWSQLAAMTSGLANAIQQFNASRHAADMSESDVDFHQRIIREEEKSDKDKRKVRRVEHCYSHVLSRVMDDTVRGSLELTGGLRPARRQGAIRHGTALTTIENILAFDLGCVLAGMCGVGNHPRLLIHDGPREGEAESELFKNLLATAQWMQSLCEPGDESFQYIVTTADAPEAYTQDHPAVADVLHGRNPDGLLLRRRF